jgi:hypothetical protein
MESLRSTRVRACLLRDDALLGKYVQAGTYTDCFVIDVPGSINQAEFVETFYTTWLFKLERWILSWAIRRPSTDAQARELAQGVHDQFAAWSVEDRCVDQLLLCDISGRTRSWLMKAEIAEEEGHSRLFFGSGVVPQFDPESGKSSLGFTFRALLGFHRCYSRLLLGAAARRLRRNNRLP